MSHDNLKDIFNGAFAAESIPFDNAAWEKMNKLLTAQRRRKLLFGWLSGSAIVLSLVGGLSLFLLNAEASYIPRKYGTTIEKFETEHVFSELASHSAEASESVELAEITNPSMVENASNTKASLISTQAQSAERQSSASIRTEKTLSTENEGSKPIATLDDKTIPTSTDSENSIESEDVVAIVSTQPAPVITASEAEQAIPAKVSLKVTRTNDQLELMPLVTLEKDAEHIDFEDRTIPDMEHKRSLTTYFNIGFSKSFDKPASIGFSRWGQRGGIGATYQLQNNLLLAAEVSIARDMVNYEDVSTRIEYGYQKYEFEQTVRVKEMLLTELPILVYYRKNRLMVGTGIKLGYLLSSRIEEENSQTVSIEEVGFAHWKDLNSLRIAVPIDINYQLNPTYFVGCRYHYGLNDVFDRTTFTDRNNRFDLYLKMNLTR